MSVSVSVTSARRLPTAFRALLLSEAISSSGSQFTLIAVPFVALKVLHASPSQVALLTGAQYLPALIVTPLAGRLADLRERAPILYLSHYGRSVLVSAVALLIVLSRLNYGVLFTASVVLGGCTAIFDTALLAYIPDTVEDDDLGRANGQMATVYAVSQSAGPAVGGLLVPGVGAAAAFFIDAASFIGGGAVLQRYRRPPQHMASDRGSISAGFAAVARSDALRRLVSAGALFNLAEQAAMSVLFVDIVQEAHRSVALAGFGLSAAGAGSVLGAWVSHRIGGDDDSRLWVWALAGCQVTLLAALWAVRIGPWSWLIFLPAMFAYGVALAFFNVHAVTRRQRLAPNGMQGRVNAVYRTLAFATIPLGSGIAALLLTVTSAPVVASLVAGLTAVATLILAGGRYGVPREEAASC